MRALALIALAAACAKPAAVTFAVAPAEPKLARAVEAILASPANVHAVVVEQHGRVLAEASRAGEDHVVNRPFARTYAPGALHDARSVGKSVIGLLAGAAGVDVTTPVAKLYPALRVPPGVTVEHLLTMTSGLAWNEGGDGPDDEHGMMWRWSPIAFALERPLAAPPGARFNYMSGGNAVLADIVARKTGTPWPDFARSALFEPLGIRDAEWRTDFLGRPMPYTGLRLRPRDMAKLGRLVLNGGAWEGRQLVPREWVEASLKPRVETGIAGLRYGYQWWIGEGWAAAFGNGGQRIFVVPSRDLCVVIAAGAYGDAAAPRIVNGFVDAIVAAL